MTILDQAGEEKAITYAMLLGGEFEEAEMHDVAPTINLGSFRCVKRWSDSRSVATPWDGSKGAVALSMLSMLGYWMTVDGDLVRI